MKSAVFWKVLLPILPNTKFDLAFLVLIGKVFFISPKETLSEAASFWPKTFLLRAPPSIFFEECVLFLVTEPR